MSCSFSFSVGFSWWIDKPAVVNDFESVFKFTAVTPVESDAAWLLACCRSDVIFYSILEAALSRGNIRGAIGNLVD